MAPVQKKQMKQDVVSTFNTDAQHRLTPYAMRHTSFACSNHTVRYRFSHNVARCAQELYAIERTAASDMGNKKDRRRMCTFSFGKREHAKVHFSGRLIPLRHVTRETHKLRACQHATHTKWKQQHCDSAAGIVTGARPPNRSHPPSHRHVSHQLSLKLRKLVCSHYKQTKRTKQRPTRSTRFPKLIPRETGVSR